MLHLWTTLHFYLDPDYDDDDISKVFNKLVADDVKMK